jgi:hypothetical protein
MKSTIFWDIMPCNPLKAIRRFVRTYHLGLQGRISEIAAPKEVASLKIEAICSSETSVDF